MKTNLILNYNQGKFKLVNTDEAKDDGFDLDEDTLARTLYGEARGEGAQGLMAVACVVMNRLRAQNYTTGFIYMGGQKTPSIAQTCLKPYQFTCWDDQRSIITGVTDENRTFSQCLSIAKMAKSGALVDITNGADHYYARYIKTPYWAVGKKPCAVIGQHIFYKLN